MIEARLRAAVDEVRHHFARLGINITAPVHCRMWLTLAKHGEGAVYLPIWHAARTSAGLRHTLLHEFGHAYLRQRWNELALGASKVFGDFGRPYPGHPALLLSRLGGAGPNHVSGYARSHPLEDFAETFAWVAEHDLDPPSAKSRVLQRKLRFMVMHLSRE